MLRITCFQSFQCMVNGNVVSDFYSAKAQALLVYLAVNQEQPHTRSSLAGLLWPDYPENRARRNLSQTLTALRKSVEEPEDAHRLLLGTPQTIAMNPESELVVDCVLFDELLRQVRTHAHENVFACSDCVGALTKAAQLYSGPFLENFPATESDLFEAWVLGAREKLHQDVLYLFTNLSRAHSERGDLDNAIDATRQLLALAPWQEEGHQQLMQLYASNGQRSQALAQYEQCASLLMDEFGVAPSNETDQLYDQILANEFHGVSSQAEQAAADGLAKPAMDSKAMVAPQQRDEQLYRALLPPLEDLVGRDAEMAAFYERLQSEQCVPIIGMTGVGKSALARHLAERWIAEKGRMEQIFWHDFYPNEAEEIIEKLAEFLAFHGQPAAFEQIRASQQNNPEQSRAGVNYRDLLGLMAREISQRTYLICLDNVHSVDDNAEIGYFLGKLLDGLSRRTSSLILIAQQMPRKLTERRFSQFRYEALSGLSLGGTQDLLSQVGVRNGLVQQLHDVTGGNAEMLMLIRSWVDPNNQVTNLLNDLYNVEAVNEFVLYKIHEELTPTQHRVMAIISLFLGHAAPREAIEMVLDQGTALADLRMLKERHLIRELVSDEGILTSTYRIHDIVRGFYYQTLGRTERITFHGQLGHYYRTQRNALRALQQYEQAHDQEAVAELLIAEAKTLVYRGHLRRILQLVEGPLATMDGHSYPREAQLYQTVGFVYMTDGQYRRAHEIYVKALAAAEEESQRAAILFETGANAYEQADFPAALAYYQDSLALYRSLDHGQGEAHAIYGLGRTHYRLEEFMASQEQLEACQALANALADPVLIARCDLTLGLIDWKRGELANALRRIQQAEAIFQSHGELKGKSHALINLGIVYYEMGDLEESLRSYQAARELCETIGDSYSLQLILHNMGYHYSVTGEPEEAIVYYRKLIETNQDDPNVSLLCRGHAGAAQAELSMGHIKDAVESADEAERLAHTHQLEAELGIILRLKSELLLVQAGHAAGRKMEALPTEVLCQAQGLLEESIGLLSKHQEKDDLLAAEAQLAQVAQALGQK